MFWRKKDPEPEPTVSFPATPYAALITDLIEMGLAAEQVVYVVHLIEVARAQAAAQHKAEMNLLVAQSRTAKPRNRCATRTTRPSRAEYYRNWRLRNKLRLVARDGDDAA
jgi:hypothetical protein